MIVEEEDEREKEEENDWIKTGRKVKRKATSQDKNS